ncbi:aspartate kinase [Helicobacter pylori]|uniref:aspartate kinase n=1 Tax=Helicobacter pylori TaxID=210 RepID=UPI002578B647|nr:aspartate kinase [Helicobacter pylori]WJI95754.1 aspartate kinase [Helicobacter pylori]
MLIVQKYGGTSMGSIERIHNVAQRVLESVKLGHQVVVVVSAMSGETDRLLEFGKNFSHNPNKREMDRIVSVGELVSSAALSMALERYGHRAISLSGKEAGILTSSHFQNAMIQSIDTKRITELLEKNYIVVIAGFQGADIQGETTTLGRGGSDLSAVALAGALKAHLCEIYTDVDGVYTTDPRIEEKAQKIAQISYDEMLELASMGAKVLLNRSVELAKKLSVKLVTRNSFNHSEGTLIVAEKDFKGERMETPIVSGIALDKNQARVSMEGVEDRPGIAAEIFGALAEYRINVDMIVQTIGRDGKTDLDFTIVKTQIEETKQALKPFLAQMDSIDYDENIAKVSIVGVGMKSHSGVASIAFKALAKDNINIMMISTSEIKISVLIDIKYAELAVRTLHAVYQLDQ